MIRAAAVHSLECPQHLHDYLTRIGGRNVYGEPKFRLVWSGNTTETQIRKWTKPATPSEAGREWFGAGEVLKYRQPARQERFIVEVWKPAPAGGPVAWSANFGKWDGYHFCLPLGPYPSRGRYQYLDTVESVDADGTRHFLWPTEAYLDTVIGLHNILLETPEFKLVDQAAKRDQQKQEADYQLILERVKMATDPKFSPTTVALDNLAALSGASDYMRRNSTVPVL